MDQKLCVLAYAREAQKCNEMAANIIRGRFEYIASKEKIDESDPDAISYRYIQRVLAEQAGMLKVTEELHIDQIQSSLKVAIARCRQAKTECENVFRKADPAHGNTRYYGVNYYADGILTAIGELHQQLHILSRVTQCENTDTGYSNTDKRAG